MDSQLKAKRCKAFVDTIRKISDDNAFDFEKIIPLPQKQLGRVLELCEGMESDLD